MLMHYVNVPKYKLTVKKCTWYGMVKLYYNNYLQIKKYTH
jgi:hypothetical protein